MLSVNGCVPLCDPVMNWPLALGVALPSPVDSWEKLQMNPVTPLKKQVLWVDRRMDGMFNHREQEEAN